MTYGSWRASGELRGLGAEEVERSRVEHGSNRLIEIRGRSFWRMARGALDDRTLKILIGAAVLVLGIDLATGGAFVDGLAILTAVAIAALAQAYNDWRAQAEFKSLQIEREAQLVRAIRDGEPTAISSFDLVVGDVLELEAGDKVPADCRPVGGTELLVDESTLTGESEAVRKLPAADHEDGGCILAAGTVVLDGRATCVVTSVGEHTEYGRLRAELGGAREPTPLQTRLGGLADRIGVLGLGAAVLIFVALALAGVVKGELGFDLGGLRQLITYATLGVTIVVVAVPEGLPVAVTLSLAFSVLRMARDKVLVRRLVACETMGAADVICADKTGTLTQNRMRVERVVWLAAPGDGAEPNEVNEALRDPIAIIAAVDSTADLDRRAGARAMGSPTEAALLEVCQGWGVNYRGLRRESQLHRVFAFTSERKRMSTVAAAADWCRVLCKGAPEAVLPLCTRAIGAGGVVPLEKESRRALQATIHGWNERALRTLVLAYRELDTGENAETLTEHDAEQDLVFVAAIAIGDPLRDEVPAAIMACRNSGIDVKIVTGDALSTAVAAGRKLGLLSEGDLVVEAGTLRDRPDEELVPLLGRLRILARAVPSDKLRLVKLLQAKGSTVAVTGDGTNDAPALRHADVGLAMGRSGTDVAREAADLILVDDSFASVVRAIRWGRTIHRNIQRFLQFQLTVSLVALVIAFVAGLTGFGTPLGVIQLLWVNLIMDTLAALALAIDPPEEVLSGAPQGRSAPLITNAMWTRIVCFGAVMVVGLLAVLYLGERDDSAAHATLVFNCFVWLQLGNLVNSRATALSESPFRGLWRSRPFLAVFALIVVVQVLIVELGGSFFHTVPLSLGGWLLSLTFGVGMVGAGLALRWAVPRMPERARHLVLATRARGTELAGRLGPWLRAPAAQAPVGVLGAAGLTTMLVGVAFRSLGSGWTTAGYALFAGGGAALGCWAWERRHGLGKSGPAMLRRHAVASITLALCLVAIVNYVSTRHYRRFDLTADRRFELSEQTVGLLARLVRPVRITALFRPSSLQVYVRDLLAEYSARSVLLQVQDVDPDRDPGEVERLKDRADIKQPELSSLVLEYEGRSRVITARELVQQTYEYKNGRRYLARGAPPRFRGEEAVSSAIVALMNDAPVKVCMVTGHGERSPDDFGPEGLALARDRLRREGYIVETVNAFFGLPAPSSCQLLVQAGPRRPLNERAQRQVADYLAAGGKWLLLVEPWENGGLEALLGEWGVEVRGVYLHDPVGRAAGVGPTTLVATRFQTHPTTASLVGSSVVFPYATSVRHKRGTRQLEGANLILTSKDGIGESEPRGSPRFDSEQDHRGDLSIAVAVNEPPNLYAADGRREPARLVVVGDTDFATNAHLHRGANADLVLNSVDWLARREELIAVRALEPEVRRLSLSARDQTALYWMSLGAMPGLVGVLGAVVSWRRRS